MDGYIHNKRKIEKIVSILSVAFWIINFVFAELSINMLLKIFSAGTSSWFDEAAKMELTNDPFFIYRTEFIMEILIGILIVIMAFCVITIVLFRNIQLKNSLAQMGMYRVLGYNKSQLLNICMREPVADMIIAFPVSIVISAIVWSAISKLEMVSFMLKLMNDNILLDIISYIMCAGVMFIITTIHTKIFMEKSIKKGIRYMLGQGVE